jgi:hypothetical protein
MKHRKIDKNLANLNPLDVSRIHFKTHFVRIPDDLPITTAPIAAAKRIPVSSAARVCLRSH